jgi:RND family efflux transporter MFP subunit
MKMFKKLTLFFLSLAVLFGCNENFIEAKISLPIVAVEKITRSTHYTIERDYIGLIQSPHASQLGFELNGKINAIYVKLGALIKKGQPLAKLDTLLLKTEQAELNAQSEQIKAELTLVKSNLVRQKQLKNKGFSSNAEIDSLISQRDALLASKKQIEAAQSSLTLRIDKSTLYAPYDGHISERHINLGDVISAGAPSFTLLSSDDKEAVFSVPLAQVAALENHTQPVQIKVGQKPFIAKQINQGAAITPDTRTVTLRYKLEDSQDLYSGELAYLKQEISYERAGYWLPLSGLTEGLRGTWNVFTVSLEKGEYKVARKAVELIYANENQVYVTGDLAPRDLLITKGLHRIVVGQAVSLIEAPWS